MNVITQTGRGIKCEVNQQLRSHLARAIDWLVQAQVSHTTALRVGDPRASGFEDELQAAAAEWKLARQSYAQHIVEHGC